LWQVPYPCRLYTPSVFEEIAHRFRAPDLPAKLNNQNAFEESVRGLLQRTVDLEEAIGGTSLDRLSDEDDYQTLLKSCSRDAVASVTSAWCENYQALIRNFPEVVPCIEGSVLAAIHKQVEEIIGRVGKPATEIDARFGAVFVLDTSVLVARPDVLKSVNPDELIIVSKEAIEELDDHRRNLAMRPRVAEATKALNAFPKDQIQFCNADPSLLPPDYRLKGDNLILSVAIKYRGCRPILVTNDNDLTLKARAENISTMSVEMFERRPAASGSMSRSQNRVSNGYCQRKRRGSRKKTSR
jgi:rRNA-processing protein FCF1